MHIFLCHWPLVPHKWHFSHNRQRKFPFIIFLDRHSLFSHLFDFKELPCVVFVLCGQRYLFHILLQRHYKQG